MEINYLAVVACTLLAMVLGALWYSPLLFGKAWMRINKMNPADMGGKAQMQKEMAVIYGLQIVLAFLQTYILAHFVRGWSDVSGIEAALWIWLGFVIPTLAGSVMWTMEKWQDKVTRFSIQAGYNLVLFIAFGYILGIWG
jgi:hypothetical protein